MVNIKYMIKRVPFLMYFYRYMKFKKEFNYDKKFFIKNYMYSKESKNTIEYNIYLLVHALEKGMSNKKIRCFGKEKVYELINELKKYQQFVNYNNEYTFIIGINVLREYSKVYENNKWTDKEEYKKVKEFLKKYYKIENKNLKTLKITKKEIMKDAEIDYNSFLESRHSIRSFSNTKLEEKDILQAINMAIKTPSACNRQMCKIYQIKNKKLIDMLLKKGQGFGGFEIDNINIFIITFDVNANYFVGERNQGWFNAGLLAMNFVNALHSLGIGSCFVQFGNSYKDEIELKDSIKIPNQERIAVLLAAGYYDKSNLVTASPRKEVAQIYKIVE